MSVNSRMLGPQARPLDATATTVIVLLCLCWGLNQVAIKLTLPDIPPETQAAVRTLGGLALVLAWTIWRGVPLTVRDGTLVPGVIAGLLFGIEFALIFRGMVFTLASRASLFLYTAPFFVALGARFVLPGEWLGPSQWFGLALCFVGLIVAVGVPQPSVDGTMLFGDLMLIAGGACWGATTLVVKATKLASAPPEKTLIYQLAVGGAVLAASAFLGGERIPAMPGTVSLSWMAFQVAVVGLTFPAWFTLLVRFSATRVSAFTFLTPLFGVAAGYLLLGEPLTVAFAIAVVLVMAGLVLVNRRR